MDQVSVSKYEPFVGPYKHVIYFEFIENDPEARIHRTVNRRTVLVSDDLFQNFRGRVIF